MNIRTFNTDTVLVMEGIIDDGDAAYLAAALRDAKGKPITIYLSSDGGLNTVAWAMYDIIRSYPGWVDIVAVGDCLSAAAEYVLQAGDRRFMTAHSILMFHEGTHGVPDLTWKNSDNWTAMGRRQREASYLRLLEVIREKKPKTTLVQLKKLMSSDWILNADDALEWGLIDEVLETLE